MSDPASPSPPAADGARPLLPDDWQALSPLVDAVLDAPPHERAAALDRASGGDPLRRAELERLVAACERDDPLLSRPASERFVHLLAEQASIPEVLGGRYRIGRELGHGGMARVYLARDVKHDRDVAVKVIRHELAASLGRERFLREIDIAARLRHPNIVPLYDSGDAGGVLYFVMPYEAGPSLRARLDEGTTMSTVDCVSTLRDVARALAHAHEQGVVHRDVKPDNVMLSGGAAVVADFGIAKAVSVAQTDVPSGTLTQLGSGIGTPAYMAPEQAVGDPSIDHRADVYSFGCLAYELFTGKQPFHGLSPHETVAAHIGIPAPRVATLRPDVPPGLGALIAQCLEKNPAARPQSARDLVAALDGVPTTGPGPIRLTTMGWHRASALRWIGLAGAAGVIGTAGYLASRPTPLTMSVIPFGNTAADTAMDYVAAQLAEEVASALARVPGIQIRSRTGARAYRGQLTVDVAEVGLKLKADYLMQGVVRQEGGRWILSAGVERALDATSVWDSVFTVSLDQQTGAAEAIAASLVSALRRQFPRRIGSAPPLRPNQQTANVDALRFYMLGQDHLNRRVQNVKQAADLFRKAIHLDTLFAPAYSGLSMALALYPYFERVPVRDVHDALVGAAHRALELDATLAQPHIALGMAYHFDYHWDSAATEFETAIKRDSRNVEARVQYARHLRFRGRYRESLGQMRVASAEEPASALVATHFAYAYYLRHHIDSALLQHARAMENDSAAVPTKGLGAMILLRANRPDDARKLAVRVPARSGFAGTANFIMGMSGDTTAARQRLRELAAETPQPWMAETTRALTYLGLGDTASALSAMERATAGKEIWHVAFGLFDPVYDSVRESARFKRLLRLVRLGP